jgi:hypothetical protein
LAFSYWIDIPWFLTEGKLVVVLITPSLGVPNWPVIYIINYTPAKHQQAFWHHSTPRHQRPCSLHELKALNMGIAGLESRQGSFS